jgi:hypothetical protein
MEPSLFIHKARLQTRSYQKRWLISWNILYARFTTIFEELYAVMLQTSP